MNMLLSFFFSIFGDSSSKRFPCEQKHIIELEDLTTFNCLGIKKTQQNEYNSEKKRKIRKRRIKLWQQLQQTTTKQRKTKNLT